ncbi:bestrophin family protein [Deminuibacter soli]|uniref:Bestrophin n=1 Tax=Deminuibacter soli TaxID=2291815 RepID=A0A3E1NE13_9BACT|nr:bestrophin family ion channel [Deminuibacter soli]RFM26117.1 hypothetical protein DXN05_21150 [Deminuibacter soli]
MLLKERIPWKYVLGKIRYELLIILVYTGIIAFLYEDYHIKHFTIPLAVPMILGTVLSLLLAFRSNQSYDRWWEARIIWGAIVNDSRTLTRQLLSFTGNGNVEEPVEVWRRKFIHRQIAWCYSLGQSLRRKDALQGLDRLLSKKELEHLKHYDNKPSAILDLHGRDLVALLQNGWVNEYQQVALDSTLTRLCDSMGKSERIKNTVFPATYSMYIHFAMLFFIVLLPFGFLEVFGYVTIPMVTMIAASFLLIEKMAIHLQDPFENKPTDTPVTTIARGIEKDLKQLLRDQQVTLPELPATEKYYVL